MMARFELRFNLDDPVDAAIWCALEPYRNTRRAATIIRAALASALLDENPIPRVQRPIQVQSSSHQDTGDDLSIAVNAFMNAFDQ